MTEHVDYHEGRAVSKSGGGTKMRPPMVECYMRLPLEIFGVDSHHCEDDTQSIQYGEAMEEAADTTCVG
jgi:hypothetical protein